MASEEVLRTFKSQIEIIQAMIEAGPAEGDQKAIVKEMFEDAQGHKMQIESALESASDEGAINRMLQMIDEFQEIGKEYEQWYSGRSVPGSHHGSHVGSHSGSHHGSHHGTNSHHGGSSHHGIDVSGGFGGGGFGSDDFGSQASPHPSPHLEIDDQPQREGSGRRKEKKRDKERRRNSDPDEGFDFAEGHHSSTSGGGFGNTGFDDAFGNSFDSKTGHKKDDAHDWPSGWGDEGSHKKDKKDDVWGAPTGSSGWGEEATATGWGASPPTAPSFSAGGFDEPPGTSNFGDKDGFGGGGGGFGSGTASFGNSWEKRPSDTGNAGAWGSDSSANHHHHQHRDTGSSHRDRHGGGSSTASHSVAHLQIHRPYSDIAHNKDAFQRNFERSIADALRIDHRRIVVKEIRRGY